MKKSNGDLRATWVGCLVFAGAFAASCAETTGGAEGPEVAETPDALSQPQFECERAKRECLVAADCAADKREACESAFRACEAPVKAERDQVRDQCRATRETCEAAATDEAGRRACHTAEHKCTLPVEPPEAVCHVDAEACIAAARGTAEPKMPPKKSDAEQACREKERECRDALHLHPEDLPKPPKCAPPPPPACTPVAAPDAAVPPAPEPAEAGDHSACERTKRECLVAANCDDAKRDACESDFRACEEPLRAERERVREMCRTARETCESAATDEAGRHACHIAEHRCKLVVEPPEAVCRVDAEECVWAARSTAGTVTMPEPMMPRQESDAERACHETERACKEAKRVPSEDLPKPPHCPPRPPACAPAAPKP